MPQIFSKYVRRLRAFCYRRRIEHALALHRRGEVRSDGLNSITLCNRLEIRWQARDVHPWDRHLPEDQRTALFAAQCLEDTEAAIFRLFEALPQVDLIGVSVIGQTEDPLIEGAVSRCDLEMARSLPSVRMRLRELGIIYHLPVAG